MTPQAHHVRLFLFESPQIDPLFYARSYSNLTWLLAAEVLALALTDAGALLTVRFQARRQPLATRPLENVEQ